MTTVIEIHTPVGPAHLSHPRLDEMDPAYVARLTELIQKDIDERGPCLNVWHPNCSVGCAPAWVDPQINPSGADTAAVTPAGTVARAGIQAARATDTTSAGHVGALIEGARA